MAEDSRTSSTKCMKTFRKKLIHDMRKRQIEKLKKARKDGKLAYFSKSEPDKLYIDGKYVQM